MLERGVVFFRAQNNLSIELQKIFIQNLGELTGKPAISTLHIYPVLSNYFEFGVDGDQVSTISSLQHQKIYGKDEPATRRCDSAQWHLGIQVEAYPADHTSLRLIQLPSGDVDALWASGYDIYDRFSPAYQR